MAKKKEAKKVEPIPFELGKMTGESFGGETFEIIKTTRGIVYKTYGGYSIFVTPNNVALYETLNDLVVNKDEYIPYMIRAVNEGHTIGVHSASHRYKEIYRSVDDYLQDFTQCYDYINTHTGYSPTIFRFPGGSVNNYNRATRKDIAREMIRRGFVYFDWNVESNDSASGMSADAIYKNVMEGCKGKQRAVILMHDSFTKNTTVTALERIINDLKKDGWDFAVLNNEVKPVIFRMK